MEEEKTPNSNYPQELREIGKAALVLSVLKEVELNPETQTELNDEIKAAPSGKEPKTEHEDDRGKLNKKKHKLDSVVSNDQNPPQKRVEFGHNHRNFSLNQQIPKDPMVHKMLRIIGQCSEELKKTLTVSDVNPALQRLQLSKNAAHETFDPVLPPKDKECLKGNKGIKVTVYGSNCKEYEMYYRYWVHEKSPVLTCGWKAFCIEEELKVGDTLRLWMFRHTLTHMLCFLCSTKQASSGQLGSGFESGQTSQQTLRKHQKFTQKKPQELKEEQR